MLYSATWAGMRTLAGDKPDADVRSEQVRRTNGAGRATGSVASELVASGQAVPSRVTERQILRLLPLLPTAR
jgi:hypothetical protein